MSQMLRKEAYIMRLLRFLKTCLEVLLGSHLSPLSGIDSHKWESKMEILRSL